MLRSNENQSAFRTKYSDSVELAQLVETILNSPHEQVFDLDLNQGDFAWNANEVLFTSALVEGHMLPYRSNVATLDKATVVLLGEAHTRTQYAKCLLYVANPFDYYLIESASDSVKSDFPFFKSTSENHAYLCSDASFARRLYAAESLPHSSNPSCYVDQFLQRMGVQLVGCDGDENIRSRFVKLGFKIDAGIDQKEKLFDTKPSTLRETLPWIQSVTRNFFDYTAYTKERSKLCEVRQKTICDSILTYGKRAQSEGVKAYGIVGSAHLKDESPSPCDILAKNNVPYISFALCPKQMQNCYDSGESELHKTRLALDF